MNIGHSISRAMSVGLPKAVKEMLRIMKGYRGGHDRRHGYRYHRCGARAGDSPALGGKFSHDFWVTRSRIASAADPSPGIAARFAAKEAVSKAFGTGIGGRVGWHDLEIANEPSGRPMVTLQAGALEVLQERGGKAVHISLSHSDGQAAAMAVLEG